MQEREVVIENKLGMHLRAAAVFIETANKFRCQVHVRKNAQAINAKSIMGLMTLGATYGSSITVIADGENEAEALDALEALVKNRFGEKE
ncbi:MAG: HPr family phosphocarrier protein [Candidatus Firestonebacteria bacterium]|nr:HPr family phosphocarrier protein [Candidatus Firestonebacteria bacterium]